MKLELSRFHVLLVIAFQDTSFKYNKNIIIINKKPARLLSCRTTVVVSTTDDDCCQQLATVAVCWQHGTDNERRTGRRRQPTNAYMAVKAGQL